MNNISKPRAYVYKLIHKITGQFYFGYRFANVKKGRLAINDLGIFYKTSSKNIKGMGFDEFTYEIIAEFDDSLDAYWFEQGLIEKHWFNALILNKQYVDKSTGKKAWRHAEPHTAEAKRNISKSLETTHPDFSGVNNGRYNSTKYDWFHPLYGRYNLSCWELKVKFAEQKLCGLISIALETGKSKQTKGWSLFKNFDENGKLIPYNKFDKNVYVWYSKKYGEFKGTKRDLVAEYPTQKLEVKALGRVTSKIYRKYKGWTLLKFVEEYKKNRPNSDTNQYEWMHIDYPTIICSRLELYEKYPEQKLFVADLRHVLSGHYKQYKGWTVKR